jgi:ATP-dependent Clp protease ATP-binding subunit ClpA
MSIPRETRHQGEAQHQAAREVRRAIERAIVDAVERGSAAVEAEHLLLALSNLPDSRGGAFLIANGLTREVLESALLAERQHSLGSVGAPQFPASDVKATRRKSRPRWGASAREAFERGFRVSRNRERGTTLNLVVGALMAELGTVPRMLSLAGIDRHQLLGRATVEAVKGTK